MNYFISHIILSIFSKYFLPFFVSVIGGTGLVSLIDAREARKQHQKDITITEIRKFRKRIQAYNKLFSKNIHLRNYQTAEDILVENMFYISSWSINIKFRRINKRMLKFSSKILLKHEYHLLNPTINKCLEKDKKSNYYQIAKRINRFFKICGTTHKWR